MLDLESKLFSFFLIQPQPHAHAHKIVVPKGESLSRACGSHYTTTLMKPLLLSSMSPPPHKD
jgi:hypothetical protein